MGKPGGVMRAAVLVRPRVVEMQEVPVPMPGSGELLVRVRVVGICGHCHYCRSGRYSLCPNVKFVGVPPYPGAMAEYVVVTQQWVYPLPVKLSFLEGALTEPLAVAMEAVGRAGVTVDSEVVIFGAGPIGLLALQVVLAKGARRVMVVDVIEHRLALAREMGAAVVVDAAR